jgi:hypothetical protein
MTNSKANTSPFVDEFLAQAPRQMTAPSLTLELRECIARWFSARDLMPNSQAILAALADLAAEQIAANQTIDQQCAVFRNFARDIDTMIAAANRKRMGGIEVELVVKQ